MDAIQLIRRDHRIIEQAFKAFERTGDGDIDQRRRAAREVIRELSVHAGIEEQLLYPALRNAGFENEVLDALEEHHAAKVTSAELDAMPADGERFAAKMKVLATSVRAHIEEEERQLLPELERLLDAEELQDLGTALEMAKRVAPTHPHPTAPDSPPGGIVANAAAGIMDRARDALRGGVEVVRFLARRGAESAFRGARDAIARGQRQAARTGAEVRQTGREGIAQARAAGRQAVAEIGNGREHGSRMLQQSARGAAAVLELSERRQARGGTTAQRQPKRGRGARGGSKKQRGAAQRRAQPESRTVMH